MTQNGRSNDTKLLPTDFQRFTPIICDSKWQANDAVLLPTDFHRFTQIFMLKPESISYLSVLNSQFSAVCCPQIFTDLHRLFVTQNGRSNDAILWPTDFHRFQRLKIEDWRLRAYHNSQLSPLSYQSFVAHRFSQIYTNIIIVNSVTYKSDTNRFSHC